MKTQIILASASMGRKRILEQLKIPFKIVASNIDEDRIIGSNPIKTLQQRAKIKGETILKHLHIYTFTRSRVLIISADSSVVLKKKLYGKPKDKKEAREILTALSGKTHEFVTALYLICFDIQKGLTASKRKKIFQKVTRTKVTFRKISPREIEDFTGLFDLTPFAGAYSILDTPNTFISKIDGSLTNVIGLPLEVILPILKIKQG